MSKSNPFILENAESIFRIMTNNLNSPKLWSRIQTATHLLILVSIGSAVPAIAGEPLNLRLCAADYDEIFYCKSTEGTSISLCQSQNVNLATLSVNLKKNSTTSEHIYNIAENATELSYSRIPKVNQGVRGLSPEYIHISAKDENYFSLDWSGSVSADLTGSGRAINSQAEIYYQKITYSCISKTIHQNFIKYNYHQD